MDCCCGAGGGGCLWLLLEAEPVDVMLSGVPALSGKIDIALKVLLELNKPVSRSLSENIKINIALSVLLE